MIPSTVHPLPGSRFTLLCACSAQSSEWEAVSFHRLLLTSSLRLVDSFSVFCCTSLLHFRVKASIHGRIILFPPLLFGEVLRSSTRVNLPLNQKALTNDLLAKPKPLNRGGGSGVQSALAAHWSSCNPNGYGWKRNGAGRMCCYRTCWQVEEVDRLSSQVQ